jgi:glycosyltransferase involved in cell wall biosynthesis
MKICLITEGSYPYIMGGVSSWINTLITNCPEHEFIIYSISCDSNKKGQYKYKIPNNVLEIVDVFLDDMNSENCKSGKKYNLEAKYKVALQSLLNGSQVQWECIFEFFKSKIFNNAGEFFMSKDFYELIYETYKSNYRYTPFTEYLWNIRSMYLTLFYLLLQELPKADVYHSICTGYAGVLAAYGKYMNKSAFILSEHGIYTREREEEIIKSTWIKQYHKEVWITFFKSLSQCAYEKSDLVTSLFEDNKKLQVGLGCKEDKIVIIPNGVNIASYENLPSKEDENVINIGAVLRIVPIKDVKTMLLSFRIVKREVPNAKFYIMGPADEDEEYNKECLDLIDALKIEDVILTGTIKVLDYIGKMDIVVLTSISEGQPLAVMEAMAAKKPNVCTNVGNCRGLLFGDGDTYGSNGFIEFVTDYEGVADSIITLCGDEGLRKSMGQNGYDRISNLYTRDNMIELYKEIYIKYGGK